MEDLKTKKRHAWMWGCLCAGYMLHAQDADHYTLQKCIDLAIQTNLSVQTAALEVESSSAGLRQARASAGPSVSGYANQGISTGKSINPYTNAFINQEVNTGQYGLNAGLTLFNGFSTINNMQQNAFNHKSNKMDYQQAKIDVSIQVALAYLQILSSEELVNQAMSQMTATQTQLDRLSVLQKNDAISPSVFYDTRGQLANDKLSLINARAAWQTAKLNLGQLLNISFSSAASFEKVTLDKVMDELVVSEQLYAEMYAAIPGIKAADYRKISALKAWHASRGNIFPVLGLNGSLASNYSSAASSQRVIGTYDAATGDYVTIAGNPSPVFTTQYNYRNDKIAWNNQVKNNFNTYVGLSLQIPLFNGLKVKTQNDLAQIKYRQVEAQQKNTELRYKALIEQLSNDLKNAFERYVILKEQVSDYEASFKVATAKFEKGAITTFEYTTSKSNYDKSRANLINIQYEYLFKGKVLDLYKKG
jgi:outer membrane protein